MDYDVYLKVAPTITIYYVNGISQVNVVESCSYSKENFVLVYISVNVKEWL